MDYGLNRQALDGTLGINIVYPFDSVCWAKDKSQVVADHLDATALWTRKQRPHAKNIAWDHAGQLFLPYSSAYAMLVGYVVWC